jgi:signal transduction histidine kinase
MFFTHEIEDIDGVFSKEQELNIYRFVQESLGNVIKHSKATEVFISVKKDEKSIKIEIEDNGVGFDLSSKLQYSKSLGIRTMKERINMLKGVLNIKSIQGKFTKIQVILNIQ